MKLADYVIERLAQSGVRTVFGISGGAAVHFFNAIGQRSDMEYCCPSHEQTAATAADGYARVSGQLGVCLTTSGPGATNLLTGIASAYYDSIPVLALTGQVATHRLRGARDVRQVGFQETDIVAIFRPITKYAVQILDPQRIRYELEKALYLAMADRRGPVLLDIPDDLQRAEIDPATLEAFIPPQAVPAENLQRDVARLLESLASAKRPLVILGAGLTTPRLDAELAQFIARFGLPMLQTWPAIDLVSDEHPLKFGPFGVYGPRSGNFAVQNADWILALGTRLSQNLTGGILPAFAREASIAMVDIDRGELEKFAGRGLQIDLPIQASLQDFFATINVAAYQPSHSLQAWLERLRAWKKNYPVESDIPEPIPPTGIDAYASLDAISQALPSNAHIFVDTGGTLTWTLNGLRTKPDQRVFSAWNNTPMGYALPAAIGAAGYDPTLPLTCITGDGGLMLCLQELALLVKHHFPIKVLLFNNHSHGIQKQTLQTWLNASYHGVDEASGLAFVDFPRVAAAIGLPVVTIDNRVEMEQQLRTVYATPGPVFCNIEINPEQKLYPVLKFGAALEAQLPALAPESIEPPMLIAPYRPPTVLIIGITSGIGADLAQRYRSQGATVLGTSREANAELRLDLREPDACDRLLASLRERNVRWDVLIFSVGILAPIGPFLETDFTEWEASYRTNSSAQWQLMHALHPLRNPDATVIFFAGGAVNGVLPNYSNYSVAKIGLIKMVEYLHAEDPSTRYSILGPGWVATKIHEQTLNAGNAAGKNLERTHHFMEQPSSESALLRIFSCIEWVRSQPRERIGGKNFSVVHDPWDAPAGEDDFLSALTEDPDALTLRRKALSSDTLEHHVATLANIISALPGVSAWHARHAALYQCLAETLRASVVALFASQEPRAVPFGPFGRLRFPYVRMGAIDTLDLFGLDEIILFAFYWINRRRYRRVADIGANLGLHSIILSRCGMEVQAYEPDPRHAEVLRQNLQANTASTVTLHCAGVSDRTGSATFVRVLGNTTSSHILGSKQPYGEVDHFEIELRDIREIASNVDFMKIDVEGHEPTLLRALQASDWLHCDVMVEISNVQNAHDVYAYLTNMPVHCFSQKNGWAQVKTFEDIPTSYREGSLFITHETHAEMPWHTTLGDTDDDASSTELH